MHPEQNAPLTRTTPRMQVHIYHPHIQISTRISHVQVRSRGTHTCISDPGSTYHFIRTRTTSLMHVNIRTTQPDASPPSVPPRGCRAGNADDTVLGSPVTPSTYIHQIIQCEYLRSIPPSRLKISGHTHQRHRSNPGKIQMGTSYRASLRYLFMLVLDIPVQRCGTGLSLHSVPLGIVRHPHDAFSKNSLPSGPRILSKPSGNSCAKTTVLDG